MIVKPKNVIRAFFDSNVNFNHLFQLENIIGEDVKRRHNRGSPLCAIDGQNGRDGPDGRGPETPCHDAGDGPDRQNTVLKNFSKINVLLLEKSKILRYFKF